MELEIKGSGADLQKVLVLIFYQIPLEKGAGTLPPSQGGVTSSAIQKLIC